MIETIIIVGGVIVAGASAAGAAVKSMIYTVQEKEEAVVQQFGRYVDTTKQAGLHVKWPWRRVTKISNAMTELKEDLQTKTKDDIFVTLPIKAHIQVEDSKKFLFDTSNPTAQVMTRIAATVKQLASKTEFSELYGMRETISEQVNASVGKELLELYGVRLVDVVVDEPHVSSDFQNRYNNVKASEMDKAAAQNKAAAEKVRIIAEAEARKEALKLDGEGVAAQRKAIFEGYSTQFNELAKSGITPEAAQQLIILAMQNDTLRDAAAKGNMIITGGNASNTLAEIAAVGKVAEGMTADRAKLAAAPQQRPGS